MLKWLKNMIKTKSELPINVTMTQDYNATWYEMQTLKEELSELSDSSLVGEIAELTQMYDSGTINRILSRYDGTLSEEDRVTLEQFYVFVNSEIGLNAN